jgi:hypothetical protein
MEAWDRYLFPPLTHWRSGREGTLMVSLPAEKNLEDYELRLGFFDERDMKSGPLRTISGASTVSVDGAEVARSLRARP